MSNTTPDPKYTVGNRPITVTVVGHCDHAESLLRILAKGNVEKYVEECMRECRVSK